MTDSVINAREIVAGYDMGQRIANNLAPGMAFLGAYGQAELCGINRATDRFRWIGFLDGFLDTIKIRFPGGVKCRDGIIVE